MLDLCTLKIGISYKAMKSPCGRWHASAYRKQSGGLFSVKRRSATNYNFMVHTQADLYHWPVPNSDAQLVL